MAEPSHGSEKWRTSHWQGLLRDSIRLIESLKEEPVWTFGGGTALAVHLDHRISYDIDIFVKDSDVLRDLAPARNPLTKQLLGNRKFEYPGQNLKLRMDEGEIDFIVAGRRTDDPSSPWIFEGRTIRLENPWEIAVKKIFYRPSTFKVRDVFDLAAVLEHHRDPLWSALSEVEDKLDKVIDRVSRIVPQYRTLIADDITPTEKGRRYMHEDSPRAVLAFLYERKSETNQNT